MPPPAVIEDMMRERLEGKEKVRIYFEDLVMDDAENVWFFSNDCNALFKIENGNDRVCFCGNVPWEKLGEWGLFRTIQIKDRKIYLIPFRASALACYDINQKEFQRIGEAKHKNSYMSSITYQQYIFAFGYDADCILRINTDTQSVDYVEHWNNSHLDDDIDVGQPYIRSRPLLWHDMIWCPLFNANILLKMDPITMETTPISVGEHEAGYSGILAYGDKLMLIPKKGSYPIVCYDMNKKNNKYINIKDEGMNDIYFTGGGVLDKIRIYSLNASDDTVVERYDNINVIYGKYPCVREINGELYIYDYDKGLLSIEPGGKRNAKQIRINIDKTIYHILDKKNNDVLHEEEDNTTSAYLNCIIKLCVNENCCANNRIGKLIYGKA